MSNFNKIQELKKLLAEKMLQYFRLKSRIKWLRKHSYIKANLTDIPTSKNLRLLDNEIRVIESQIGQIKASNCPALSIEEKEDWLHHRKCLLERIAWDDYNDREFFEQACFGCPFTPEDAVAMMAANAFRKDKHEQGD